jgi:DNA repair exonuclease SbcCD nuclease subunit
MDAFVQAIDIGINRGVDAVLSAGYLFQSRSPGPETLSKTKAQLDRLNDEEVSFLLAHGKKEIEHDRGFLKSREKKGLIKNIGGEAVEVAPEVFIYGVDHGYESRVKESDFNKVGGESFLGVAVGGLTSKGGGKTVNRLKKSIPVDIDAFFMGNNENPIFTHKDGIVFIDPGAIENTLSKSTIKNETTNPRVHEYRLRPEDRDIKRHELDVRDYEILQFEVGEETQIEDIRERAEDVQLSGKVVLAELEGYTGSLTDKQVRNLLEKEAYCVKVYDKRYSQQKASESEVNDFDKEIDRLRDDLRKTLSSLDTLSDITADSSTKELADAYVTSSELESLSDSFRKKLRDELLSVVDVGGKVDGDVGIIKKSQNERKELRGEEDLYSVLLENDVSPNRVLSVEFDEDKLEAIVEDESTDIDEEDIFREKEYEYIRKQEFYPSS